MAEGRSEASVTIWPEYCAGPWYVGWHLYERERVGEPGSDPIPNERHRPPWGWLRDAFDQRHAYELCASIGHGDMPAPARYGEAFEREFARRFPRGIRVTIGEFGRYEPAQGGAREGDEG